MAAALAVVVLLAGGVAVGESRWDNHTRVQLIEEIEVRDELIGNQESLLNAYRCRFNIDTHIVPSGCTDGGPAQEESPSPDDGLFPDRPPSRIQAWEW